jgi:hypothetical protein
MTRELGEILSGQPAQEEAPSTVETPTAPEPSTEPTESQPRGPDGKFASKATEPAEPAAAPAEPAPTADKPKGVVPQPALHAAREKARTVEAERDDLARQLAELKGQVSVLTQQRQPAPAPVEPPKPVDFWEDPNKFVEQALTPYQQELLATRVELSQTRAIASFGADAVTAAETAMQEAIQRGELNGEQVAAQLKASRDPVGDVVRWHQNSPAVKEAALRQQIEAEMLAKYGQQPAPEPAPAAPAAAPSVMPSDLAGARNVGTRSGPAWGGPAPLKDIFDRTRKTG